MHQQFLKILEAKKLIVWQEWQLKCQELWIAEHCMMSQMVLPEKATHKTKLPSTHPG
jgi:hypothetical protein